MLFKFFQNQVECGAQTRVWIVLGFPLNDSTPLWKQVVSCQGLFCWSLSSVVDDEGMKDLLDRLPFLAKV